MHHHLKKQNLILCLVQGISREGDVLDLAANLGIVNKSGAWYAYNDDKIGQGRENAKIFLKEHKDIMDEVEVKVREQYGLCEGGKIEPASKKATASDKDTEEEE